MCAFLWSSLSQVRTAEAPTVMQHLTSCQQPVRTHARLVNAGHMLAMQFSVPQEFPLFDKVIPL